METTSVKAVKMASASRRRIRARGEVRGAPPVFGRFFEREDEGTFWKARRRGGSGGGAAAAAVSRLVLSYVCVNDVANGF